MSKSIRRPLSSLMAVFAASAGALALGACNGVGDGNSLDRIHIVPAEFSTTLEGIQDQYTDLDAYQCAPRSLNLFGTFTRGDDDIGDFTTRANWVSDNPAIARVSNGDIASPVDSTITLGKGVIVPGNVGETTIRANYLDLQATITVKVAAPTDFTITPANPYLTLHSRQGLQLHAKLGGVETNLTAVDGTPLVKAAFNPASDTLATVAVSRAVPIVTALGVTGSPLTLELTLPYCNQVVSTTINVAVPASLDLTHEEGFNGGELIVNTNELLTLKANFGEGIEPQDLTSQAAFSRANDATDSDAASRLSVGTGVVTALKAGAAVPVRAACCAIDLNGDGDTADEGETAAYTSNSLSITPVAGDLTSFTIAPLAPTVVSGETQQFTAQGTFDNGARTQPITRQVTWSSGDRTVAAFPGSPIGLMQSVANLTETDTAEITATPNTGIDGTTVTAPIKTTVTVTPAPAAE